MTGRSKQAAGEHRPGRRPVATAGLCSSWTTDRMPAGSGRRRHSTATGESKTAGARKARSAAGDNRAQTKGRDRSTRRAACDHSRVPGITHARDGPNQSVPSFLTSRAYLSRCFGEARAPVSSRTGSHHRGARGQLTVAWEVGCWKQPRPPVLLQMYKRGRWTDRAYARVRPTYARAEPEESYCLGGPRGN